jgi:hypothetical protein
MLASAGTLNDRQIRDLFVYSRTWLGAGQVPLLERFSVGTYSDVV